MTKDTLAVYSSKFNELRSIFDSLPDGIVTIIDKEMKIVAANKAASDLFKLPDKKIVGRPLIYLLQDKNLPLREIVEQTIKTQKPVRNYTIEFTYENGVKCTFLVSTAILKEVYKNEKGIVLILHDISEVTRLRKLALQMQRYGEIIGNSGPMRHIYATIDSIKDYDTSVLIVGETGTGKELIARAIHNASRRKDEPFIPVNCSALPVNLIESELFGHVKGAFTGAIADRPGRFKMASGGTLFLDEIGTLSLDLQVKLLRVIQQKIVEPVGSSKNISVDVRIISASNRDLSELVERREFRDDLFYRLKVFQITVPPLRIRSEDIPLLVNHFIERLNNYYNKNIMGISPSALEILMSYPFPGNVRELENAIEHAFVLTNSSIIEAHTLPIEMQSFGVSGNVAPPKLRDLGDEEEKIRTALISAKGNIELASSLLKTHRSTLWRKMKEFRISKGFGKS